MDVSQQSRNPFRQRRDVSSPRAAQQLAMAMDTEAGMQDYTARLETLFPRVSWCMRYFLAWNYASASKLDRRRFFLHWAFIATVVSASIASGVGVAAALQEPAASQRLGWTSMGTLMWFVAPFVAALLCVFGFPRLAALYPVMGSYENLGLGGRKATSLRIVRISLLLPVVGVLVSTTVGGLVYQSRNVGGEPTIVRVAYALDLLNLVLYYGISAPLVYCTTILMLVLHWQQACTLHQLIEARDPRILEELDPLRPLSKRLLLVAAPEKHQRPHTLQQAASLGSIPSLPPGWTATLNPVGLRRDPPRPAPPAVAPAPCSARSRSISLPSSRSQLQTGTGALNPLCTARPEEVSVDDAARLHDAVRRSVRHTALAWQFPLVAGFIVGVCGFLMAIVNVLNGTTGTVAPLWYAWLAAGPLLALFFLGPVVWYNSVWPSLMSSAMNWGPWKTAERTYLLSLLSAPDSKLAFPLFGFDMSARDLLKVLGPMLLTAGLSQLWNMRDRVIHTQ